MDTNYHEMELEELILLCKKIAFAPFDSNGEILDKNTIAERISEFDAAGMFDE